LSYWFSSVVRVLKVPINMEMTPWMAQVRTWT
jgi:hypothetical protein